MQQSIRLQEALDLDSAQHGSAEEEKKGAAAEESKGPSLQDAIEARLQ